jgi:hypothetical protein
MWRGLFWGVCIVDCGRLKMERWNIFGAMMMGDFVLIGIDMVL